MDVLRKEILANNNYNKERGKNMDQIILEMKNIDKRFSGVHALKSVNLELRKGEVHALMGENGA